MGERTALWSQQNSTEEGSLPLKSPPEMQHADEGEEPPRGVVIDLHLAREPLLDHPRALVVDATAGHVDRLDLGRRHGLDRVEIAFADLEIVLHHLPERPQRELELGHRGFLVRTDIEHEATVADRQLETEGAFGARLALAGDEHEAVVFEKIEDRHPPLLLDLGCWRGQAAVIDL